MSRKFLEKDVKLENGMGVHYYEWPGQGPNLIFLHPSSGYARIWEWTADALGNQFHIYAPDQRGHGQTDKPDGDYSAQEYAGDVYLFMQKLGLEQAWIIGHSLGGRVAQVFAAEHPERTLALGLVAGPHLTNFYGTRNNARAILEGAYSTISHPTEYESRDEIFAFLKGRRPWTYDPDAALYHRIEHNYVQLSNGKLAPRYDTIRVAQGLSHMSDNLRPYAARVRCPVFIFRASLGEGLTAEQAEEVARFWSNAQVVDVKGHYTLEVENPVELAKAISSVAPAGR